MTRLQRQLDLNLEESFWIKNQTIIGVDEVGRGCLAGPVVVAAVSFPLHHMPDLLIRDSKKLSQKLREELCAYILNQADSVGLGLMTVATIDAVNILEATKLAMTQALAYFPGNRSVFIDGRDIPEEVFDLKVESIIKGDDSCYSIAAASIVAKVIRDRMMTELGSEFPEYDWANNKGYGTKKHRAALLKYGPTRHHREKFIRKILSK